MATKSFLMVEVASIIADAKLKMKDGRYGDAYGVLKPLIEARIPEALFLYSTFSPSEEMETDDEFEDRSIYLLTEAAKLGYLPAIYALGVCYDNGDLVGADKNRAAILYEEAAKAGYAKAKFRHGLNCFYGSFGIKEDKNFGMNLIEQAASEGVADAIDFLNSK